MTRLLLLSHIIIALLSCTTNTNRHKNTIELKKQYDYRIEVEVWNGFAGYASKFVLDNRRIGMYDSLDEINGRLKPLTLYHLSYAQKANKDKPNLFEFIPTDTSQITFTQTQSDTLFELTRTFFQTLYLNNVDTAINGVVTKPVVMDDDKGRVQIDFDGKTLRATISSLNNPSITTPQFDTLRNFCQKFEQH